MANDRLAMKSSKALQLHAILQGGSNQVTRLTCSCIVWNNNTWFCKMFSEIANSKTSLGKLIATVFGKNQMVQMAWF